MILQLGQRDDRYMKIMHRLRQSIGIAIGTCIGIGIGAGIGTGTGIGAGTCYELLSYNRWFGQVLRQDICTR